MLIANLAIEGAVITIDAMGYKSAITELKI